jgi:hypothetical protein
VDDVPKAVLDDFDYQARAAGLDLLELTANRLYPGASRFVETVQHDFRIASHNFQVVVVPRHPSCGIAPLPAQSAATEFQDVPSGRIPHPLLPYQNHRSLTGSAQLGHSHARLFQNTGSV